MGIKMEKEIISFIGAGFHCIDIIQTDSQRYIALGGTAANVTAIFSSFSQNSSFICPQYTDTWGKWFQDELYNRKIQPLFFTKTKTSMPRIIEHLNISNGLHSFHSVCSLCGKELSKNVLPNTNNINDEIILQAKDANIFFFDRVSSGIKELAHQHYSGWTYYEPNTCRNYISFLEMAKTVDIVKFSSSRIPGAYISRLLNDLQASNVQLVISTMGASGFSFSYRDKNGKLTQWVTIDSSHIDSILDSSGAGDWFTATFLLTFLRKYPYRVSTIDYDFLDYALNTAKKVSSIKCGFLGVHGIFENAEALETISSLLDVRICNYSNHSFCWGTGCKACGL